LYVFVHLNCLFSCVVSLQNWLAHFLLIRNNGEIHRNKHFLSPENAGNKNNGNGNGAGLAWESYVQVHCFADRFLITHAHSFGTDTQHGYRQGKCI